MAGIDRFGCAKIVDYADEWSGVLLDNVFIGDLDYVAAGSAAEQIVSSVVDIALRAMATG